MSELHVSNVRQSIQAQNIKPGAVLQQKIKFGAFTSSSLMQRRVDSQYIPPGSRSVALTTPSPDGGNLWSQGEKTIELETGKNQNQKT